jgi:hypothetical protein
LTKLCIELLGEPIGDRARSESAGLRVTDPTVAKQAGLQTEFWKLGAFARPGLPADDHRLAIGQYLKDLLAMIVDRQFRIIVDPIRRIEPLIKASVGRFEGSLPSLQILLNSLRTDALESSPLPSESGRIVPQESL